MRDAERRLVFFKFLVSSNVGVNSWKVTVRNRHMKNTNDRQLRARGVALRTIGLGTVMIAGLARAQVPADIEAQLVKIGH